ncbi:MAG: hypothetical protein AB1722_09685 [Pseudomonadota bacterium]
MRTLAMILEAYRADDPGTIATCKLIQQIELLDTEFGPFVEVLVTGESLNLSDSAIGALISNTVNVRIGWEPEGDDDILPSPLRCWLETGHKWIEVGVVSSSDEKPMRERLGEYYLRAKNGGIGMRQYPLMHRTDGARSFIVELLNC